MLQARRLRFYSDASDGLEELFCCTFLYLRVWVVSVSTSLSSLPTAADTLQFQSKYVRKLATHIGQEKEFTTLLVICKGYRSELI